LALADISGKGLYAALLMASVQAALHTAAALDGHRNTAEMAALLNRHLFLNTSEDRYATLFLAVYDSATHKLEYTNAGHLAPFLVCDGCLQRLEDGGTVVGLIEDAEYTQKEIAISPGSVLLAFSDGLTEIENVYGEEFGMDRLKTELLKRRNLPAGQLAQELIAAAEQWAGSPEQADDITVVVARMG
jgi:sigma-B regulation protein RsbU (phosphoserine phosphatase)